MFKNVFFVLKYVQSDFWLISILLIARVVSIARSTTTRWSSTITTSSTEPSPSSDWFSDTWAQPIRISSTKSNELWEVNSFAWLSSYLSVSRLLKNFPEKSCFFGNFERIPFYFWKSSVEWPALYLQDYGNYAFATKHQHTNVFGIHNEHSAEIGEVNL